MDTIVRKFITSQKIRLPNIGRSFSLNEGNNQILVKWDEENQNQNNFAGSINPWLIEKITGSVPINSNKIYNIYKNPVYACIGSILDYNDTKNLVVWGAGFQFSHGPFKETPEKILAVRGPLSRDLFLKQGIDCPEVYGDPTLLLPQFYQPVVQKEFKLGILAHPMDKDKENLYRFMEKADEKILYIDSEDPLEVVIKNILKCEKIASSSLHGIMAADAYGIPSLQIKFTDKVTGGTFKFKDYMASVKRKYNDPLQITEYINPKQVYDQFEDYEINIDLDTLYKVCPFN